MLIFMYAARRPNQAGGESDEWCSEVFKMMLIVTIMMLIMQITMVIKQELE